MTKYKPGDIIKLFKVPPKYSKVATFRNYGPNNEILLIVREKSPLKGIKHNIHREMIVEFERRFPFSIRQPGFWLTPL